MKDSLEVSAKVDLLTPPMSYLTQLSQFDNWPVVRKPKYSVGDRVIVRDAEGHQLLATILRVNTYFEYGSVQSCKNVNYVIGEWDQSKERWFTSDGWEDDHIISVVERAN